MNIRNLSIASLVAISTLSGSPLSAAEQADAPAYQYGMQLDIAKVIRIEEPTPPVCELVRAQMTYLTSEGKTETVSFLKQADSCLLQ
jgi:hypothetical protein